MFERESEGCIFLACFLAMTPFLVHTICKQWLYVLLLQCVFGLCFRAVQASGEPEEKEDSQEWWFVKCASFQRPFSPAHNTSQIVSIFHVVKSRVPKAAGTGNITGLCCLSEHNFRDVTPLSNWLDIGDLHDFAFQRSIRLNSVCDWKWIHLTPFVIDWVRLSFIRHFTPNVNMLAHTSASRDRTAPILVEQ